MTCQARQRSTQAIPIYYGKSRLVVVFLGELIEICLLGCISAACENSWHNFVQGSVLTTGLVPLSSVTDHAGLRQLSVVEPVDVGNVAGPSHRLAY